MNLELSEEQTAVRRLAREFTEREVVPYAAEWDRAESVDRAIVKKLGALGFLGLTVPEEYGGSGGDHLAYVLVTEELGRGDSAVRGIVSVSLGLVAKTIAAWGTEDQKRAWLPRLCSGDALGCFGLTEPGTGSDAATSPPAPCATGTRTSWTAARCSSPTAPGPTWCCSSPAPVTSPATAGSPPSSSPPTPRA